MRLPWRAALGLALTVALLWLALRGTDWTKLWSALQSSSLALWALAVVVSQLIYPLRARRWRPILTPVAPNVSFGPMWRATAIGLMVTTLVPARVGELARAYALAREEPRVPFAAGLASLFVDRVFDAVVVLILIVVALLDPHFTSAMTVTFHGTSKSLGALVAVATAGTVGVLAVLSVVVYAPASAERMAARLARTVVPRWEPAVVGIARKFIEGLAVLRRPALLVATFAWAMAHWVTSAASIWIAFRALSIDVPITAAFFVQGLLAIGAAAFPTQGFFGVFELAGLAGLSVYGVDRDTALAWALTYHVLTLIPITLFGLWYVGKAGLSFGEIRQTRAQAPAQ